MSRTLLIGWSVAFIALCALVAVVWHATSISGLLEKRAALYADSVQHAIATEDSARHRAVFNSTISERAALEQFSQTQLLQMVDTIQRAGRDAGVPLTVSAASRVEVSGTPLLRPVDFTVEGKGSFGALMRALYLLEVLPLPSRVTQTSIGLEVEATKQTTETWSGTFRIRVYTSSNL